MGKQEWKEAGKGLGHAFEGLAKTVIRSAAYGVDKAEAWAEGNENAQPEKSNVFKDGSWRETGKNLGHAFQNASEALLHTGEETVDKAEAWAEGDKSPGDGQQ